MGGGTAGGLHQLCGHQFAIQGLEDWEEEMRSDNSLRCQILGKLHSV